MTDRAHVATHDRALASQFDCGEYRPGLVVCPEPPNLALDRTQDSDRPIRYSLDTNPQFHVGRTAFTDREKEVLELIVAGRSNKEIGSPLGIQERTVKANVAKLLRKVGVQNRIALSVHALTHSLVNAK